MWYVWYLPVIGSAGKHENMIHRSITTEMKNLITNIWSALSAVSIEETFDKLATEIKEPLITLRQLML